MQAQEAIAGTDVIAKKTSGAVVRSEQQIHIAIAIKIGKSEPASNASGGKISSIAAGDILEFSFAEIEEEVRRLSIANVAANIADGIVDVAVRDDQIETAIKIEIGKAATKAESCFRRASDTGGYRDVIKLSRRGRAIEANHFVVKICDGDSCVSGIFKISHIDAHAGAGFAFTAEGDSGLHRRVLECAIVLVAIQLIWLSVVSHEQVGPAIVAVIKQRHS